MGLVLIIKDYKKHFNSYISSRYIIISFLALSLVKNTKLHNINGRLGVITSLFFLIFFINFHGTLPYTLGLTSHLAIGLTIALPLWLSIVLIRSSFSFSTFLVHLLPAGSPAYLNPFLCLIEFVRLIIRPMTLTVRVVANLRTGHILIGLLAGGCLRSPGMLSLIVIIVGSLYIIFEIAVCLVQAYIFTLLPTLYGDEHPE